MVKHTPGPWNVMEPAANEDGIAVVGGGQPLSSEEGMVAWCQRYMHTDGHDTENMANARLIAAAPELLEACKVGIESIDPVTENAEVRKILRDAINRAEGQEPPE